MSSFTTFFLVLAFLFFCGSLAGWVIELIYRRFFSAANKERKWINPGFLVGPYIPLYGLSLVFLCLLSFLPMGWISNIWVRRLVLFIIMSLVITLFEYIAGLIFIKGMHIKLWDYENEWGNIKGIICPKFTFYWMCLSAAYYFLIHPRIIKSIIWLVNHLAFSFVVGFFYGVFLIDFVYSMQLMVKLKRFADEYEIIVKFAEFQQTVRAANERRRAALRFAFSVSPSGNNMRENVKKYMERQSEKFEKLKDEISENLEKVREEINENLEKVKEEVNESIQKMKDK